MAVFLTVAVRSQLPTLCHSHALSCSTTVAWKALWKDGKVIRKTKSELSHGGHCTPGHWNRGINFGSVTPWVSQCWVVPVACTQLL